MLHLPEYVAYMRKFLKGFLVWFEVLRGIQKDKPLEDEDRLKAIASLPSWVTPNPSVARFLLAEVKDAVEKKRTVHRTLEAKATGVIGFASASLAFATSFRAGDLFLTLWSLFGFIPLTFAVLIGVWVLSPQKGSFPNALKLNLPSVIKNPKNEARIASRLAEIWGRYELSLETGAATREARLGLAFKSYIFGFLCIIGLSVLTVMGVIGQKATQNPSAPRESPIPCKLRHPISAPIRRLDERFDIFT